MLGAAGTPLKQIAPSREWRGRRVASFGRETNGSNARCRWSCRKSARGQHG